MKPNIRITVNVYVISPSRGVTGQGDFQLDRPPTDDDFETMERLAVTSMARATGFEDWRPMTGAEVEELLAKLEQEALAQASFGKVIDGEATEVSDVN